MLSIQKYSTRQQIGQWVGIIGLTVNLILFLAKCAMGLISNSISILADALNNLTDCASSLAALIGFKICGKQADDKHPNGYGRMEYVSGFLISFFIMATALSCGKTAFTRILNPQETYVPIYLIWIPLAAIAMKLGLAGYTNFANKGLESAALKAIYKDSISDAILTAMTFLSLLITPFTAIPLDAIISLLISGAVLWSGFTSFNEHLDLLLGKGDKELEARITEIVLEQRELFWDITSITTIDYGPEKQLAFIQVELNTCAIQENVPAGVQKLVGQLKDALHLDATIYWYSEIDGPYELLQH